MNNQRSKLGNADTGKFLLVEAKGFPTADWKRQLQLLDTHNPNLIDKIKIVQGVSTKIDECFTSITIAQLHCELEKLKEVIDFIDRKVIKLTN